MKTKHVGILILAATIFSARAAVEQFTSASWRAKLEADWLTDAKLRSASPTSVTLQSDAAGGCDGIKNGQWGFHTGHDKKPWWQVDLGEPQAISRIVIWNRCDAADRAKHLTVSLSDNGKQWRKVYTHNGKTFFGFTDKKPLEIKLANKAGRIVRVQLEGQDYLHLDEVEVFGPAQPEKNLALHRPAKQCSLSQWSGQTAKSTPKVEIAWPERVQEVLSGSEWLVNQLRAANVNCSSEAGQLNDLSKRLAALKKSEINSSLYFEARTLQRKLALANPLLNFDKVLFAKRAPGTFSHMSDQYYGWWSRGGGGICVLENFKSDSPRLTCLTEQMPSGSFLRPEISYDGKKVVFAFCKFYPEVAKVRNKTDKEHLPEDAFYHVFEMKVDGTGLKQLTHGRYDDFDARYSPNGELVFLSTRRGISTQAGKNCATRTLTHDALPDSFVRCGGDDQRPVSVYTLHVMNSSGGNLRAISPFENFEWTPSIANDGRISYSRWDYIDRDNMPFMSLWTTNPDGTSPQLVYGNLTRNPYAVLEARPIPNSRKMIFTASAHHSISGGSLVLLDPTKGSEDAAPLRRLTPEVCFPETEGWPETFYAGANPLSEDFYLTGWSNTRLIEQSKENSVNGLGIYLYDSFGNRDLVYRDSEISSMDPIPVRARTVPPIISSHVDWDGAQEGKFLLQNIYEGLNGVRPGEIKNLRIVAVPAKTQPQKDFPNLGLTRDDPGKCVLGTVPVEKDGSAFFRVPSGVNVFFQALDADGFAIQTMRTVTYVQPNQTFSCAGCHEPRTSAPQNFQALAGQREASKITPGPDGSWPLRYDKLVQPVLDKRCVNCHSAGNENKLAAKFDLSTAGSYEKLVSFGSPSLKQNISSRYVDGYSLPGQSAAKISSLLAYLNTDPTHRTIQLDRDDRNRLVTWMDTYAQRLGSFSVEQERELQDLKKSFASLLEAK